MRIEGLARPYMTQEAVRLLECCQNDGPTEVLWVHLDSVADGIKEFFPSLKAVACPCTGTDHITASDVDVISLQGWHGLASLRGVSEWTVKLIIDCLRNGGCPTRDRAPSRTLAGATVCIVGYGRIGRHVEQVCSAMGANVKIDDPRNADVVTVHLPLTSETEGVIGRSWLRRCKPGAVIINTSRPQLVRTAPLIEALDAGDISWYAEDFTDVPRPHPRVIQTPHIAGWTTDLRQAELYIAQQVVKYLEANGSNPAS